MRTVFKSTIIALVFVFFLGATQCLAEEINRVFDAKKRVMIETVSGDVEIRKGESDKIEVTVIYNVRPRDSFEPVFRDRGRSLRLEERIYDSSSGHITWIVTVPENTEIKFSSASGGFTMEDMTGDFTGSTASGDYTLNNCSGYFDLNTASGDYTVEDCAGEFDLNSASGDLNIRNVTINEKSEFNSASGDVDCRGVKINRYCNFNSASGDVEVKLASSPDDDINVNSASGDALLDYNGNDINGYIELTAKRRGGRIRSDLDFDDEEEYIRHGQWYVKKSATIGSDSPYVTISTASGKAELIK